MSQGSPAFPALPSWTEDSRLLDLELMHQYTASTFKSISVPTVNGDVWQVFVPRQALKYEFLMHAILGLAALQVSVEDADQREKYKCAYLNHQSQGFAAFSEALSKLDENNCHSLFAFAVIAMIFALASPQHITTSTSLDNDNTADCQRVFILCDFLQGITTVAVAGWQWIKDGPFGVFLDLDNNITLHSLDAEDEDMLKRLHKFNDTLLAVVDPLAHMTITSSIHLLEKCIRGGEMMALAWVAMCGKHFMTLLGQHQRLAQLVFMHWTILLNRLDRLWWVKGAAELWFNEISSELVVLGPEWLEVVEDIRSKHRLQRKP
ncbi:hypothetical protein LTR84_004234 [Exophiala bonariae]|uniref:Transcription factor domain-containing protein n=1 Tax=Exophiala bonariae TaxID=1690606 RepID=A0AAV9N428_9EURO|nr:hypothetical protein LTR84_004234 [Exophiala bonariae]